MQTSEEQAQLPCQHLTLSLLSCGPRAAPRGRCEVHRPLKESSLKLLRRAGGEMGAPPSCRVDCRNPPVGASSLGSLQPQVGKQTCTSTLSDLYLPPQKGLSLCMDGAQRRARPSSRQPELPVPSPSCLEVFGGSRSTQAQEILGLRPGAAGVRGRGGGAHRIPELTANFSTGTLGLGVGALREMTAE